MKRLMYPAIGMLILAGTAVTAGAATNGAGATSSPKQATMDIRALERTIDLKTLPNGGLDPAVYE